jgi:hypothetical protein
MIDYRMTSKIQEDVMEITSEAEPTSLPSTSTEVIPSTAKVPLKSSTQAKLNVTAEHSLGLKTPSAGEKLAEPLPKWVILLLAAFKYISKEEANKDSKVKKTKYHLECKLCEAKDVSKQSGKNNEPKIIQDTQAKAFLTHLTVKHLKITTISIMIDYIDNINYFALQRKHAADKTAISVLKTANSSKKVQDTPENIKAASSVKNYVAADLYSKTHPQQIRFINELLKFIVVDGAPLNTPEGKGFRELIKSIDPKLNIPNRTTITRKIDHKFKEVS